MVAGAQDPALCIGVWLHTYAFLILIHSFTHLRHAHHTHSGDGTYSENEMRVTLSTRPAQLIVRPLTPLKSISSLLFVLFFEIQRWG